jgi:hypothetical protein
LQAELSAGEAKAVVLSLSSSTAAAIAALDELGEPKPGAARALLRTVAKRPRAPVISVSGYDEP